MLKVYVYKNCDTCRKALKYLDQRDIPYESHPIVDTPPSPAEIRQVVSKMAGGLPKVFNTSGQLYRSLNMKEKLKTMAEDELVGMLHEHGKLIKRPFVVGSEFATVGFKAEVWDQELT